VNERGSSAWDGEWTGLEVVQFVTGEFSGEERCFALCVDCAGRNSLWEITRNYEFDLTWPNETVPTATERIRKDSYVELRQMDFEKPFVWKSLERGDFLFFNVKGQVDYKVEYRGELEQNYTTWDFGSFGFAFETCELTSDVTNEELPYCSPPTLNAGSQRIRLGRPKDDTCSDGSGRLSRYSREFQLKISWTGEAALNKLQIVAQSRDEAMRGDCQT